MLGDEVLFKVFQRFLVTVLSRLNKASVIINDTEQFLIINDFHVFDDLNKRASASSYFFDRYN